MNATPYANASGSGLKVNLHTSTNGATGSGQYCVHGGGETLCRNAHVPGEVQIQFGKGVVPEGGSIRGCVDFNGQTECDSGTNGPEKKPEDLYVHFNSGGSNSGSQSQAQVQSQSSQSQSQSQSQAQSQSICLIGPCD